MTAFGFSSRHTDKGKTPTPKKSIPKEIGIAQPTAIAASLSLESLPSDALLRESQLVPSPKRPGGVAILPFSGPTLWRRVAALTWPAPIKLSDRISAWRAGECRAVLAAQIAGYSESEIKALVQHIHAQRQQAVTA